MKYISEGFQAASVVVGVLHDYTSNRPSSHLFILWLSCISMVLKMSLSLVLYGDAYEGGKAILYCSLEYWVY